MCDIKGKRDAPKTTFSLSPILVLHRQSRAQINKHEYYWRKRSRMVFILRQLRFFDIICFESGRIKYETISTAEELVAELYCELINASKEYSIFVESILLVY